ncbi:hypothetical protein, partial [Rosenbergiella epipactidis]|uniref:hypothetical protein n=1 Tax=Rosenbergiella epipactidis TaxID=1544694 RepID=UPI001F4ED3B4
RVQRVSKTAARQPAAVHEFDPTLSLPFIFLRVIEKRACNKHYDTIHTLIVFTPYASLSQNISYPATSTNDW